MDFNKLQDFITSGLDKWESVKKDFSHDREMSAWLKKAYPVAGLDHHRLDIDFVRKLNTESGFADKGKPGQKEMRRESYRRKMAAYIEGEMERLFIEIRFPGIRMELINRVKAHPAIGELNGNSPASIRVIVDCMDVGRERGSEG